MSLMTRAYLLDKYGLRLTLPQIAEVMGVSYGTLRRTVAHEGLPFPTYREGGRRFASYEAVAEYFDSMNEKARVEARASEGAEQ